jgi:hypothetical protein
MLIAAYPWNSRMRIMITGMGTPRSHRRIAGIELFLPENS